ncbi:hypothetical protein V4C53_46205, partial [Paraburkholderia azotifigens]|uniref:hypothetical protein n=1 Tax=Paraburkholderia azotifigens TaxID=2057004 RepID=UPI0031769745
MDTPWRRSAGLDLAVEAGAAPVVLLWQTPFYHADGPPRFRARLQSPYGLPTPRPESTSRSPCVERFRDACLHARVPPPYYDAAVYCRFTTAVHNWIRLESGSEKKGRKSRLTDHPEWNAVFLDVVREHTAGNPQHGIIWTDLKPREIAQAMTQ